MLFFYAVFRVRLVLFRHLQDCHNIFFRQRLEEANVSVSAENAFLSHFLDLGIGWINAKFSEGGWHVYRVAPSLPGSDGCENSIRNIRIAGLGSINSENLLTKLCKSSRICLIHISRPASPDRCKSGSVSYIKHTAEFMLNLMCGEIRYPSGTGQTVYGERLPAHMRVARAS